MFRKVIYYKVEKKLRHSLTVINDKQISLLSQFRDDFAKLISILIDNLVIKIN